MRPFQIVVIAAAVVSGAIAFVLINKVRTAPPDQVVQVVPEKPQHMYLAASRPLDVGAVLGDADFTWKAVPDGQSAPLGAIMREANPNVLGTLVGGLPRRSFGVDEAIVLTSIVRPGDAGFLAAALAPGMRAMSINIDMKGTTTAGGFVAPNDRVDVIHVGGATGAGPSAQTILRNIRVLAIGKSTGTTPNPPAEGVVNMARTAVSTQGDVLSGQTATLEVTRRQAEILLAMQDSGKLSLALRSAADASVPQAEYSLRVVNFGNSAQIESQ